MEFSELELGKYRPKAGKSYKEAVDALIYPIDIVYSHFNSVYELRTSKIKSTGSNNYVNYQFYKLTMVSAIYSKPTQKLSNFCFSVFFLGAGIHLRGKIMPSGLMSHLPKE